MGEGTDIIEAKVEAALSRRRNPLMQIFEKYVGTAMLVALGGGGLASGVATDKFGGGEAARSHAQSQIELVVAAADTGVAAANARADAAEGERDRAILMAAAADSRFMACIEARLEEHDVAGDIEVPSSALEIVAP